MIYVIKADYDIDESWEIGYCTDPDSAKQYTIAAMKHLLNLDYSTVEQAISDYYRIHKEHWELQLPTPDKVFLEKSAALRKVALFDPSLVRDPAIAHDAKWYRDNENSILSSDYKYGYYSFYPLKNLQG